MHKLNRRTTLAAIGGVFAMPLYAHSVTELEQEFGARERYFQALDKATPDFTLSDADAKIHRPADFAGKVVILHFIYTSCTDVCPLHAEKLADVQDKVNQTPMADLVEFVSITTDPRNDTPEVLKEYGPVHGLNPVNWTFLTTAPGQPEDTTRKLAMAFGHKFDVADDGTQMHGIVTHVIDKTGRWRANFHGLDFETVNMVLLVNAMSNDYDKPQDPGESGLWGQFKALFN